jgi:8-oxo-dGTP diphosphatase
MKDLQEARDFFENGYLQYRPNLTIDCAIFGYHNGELNVLLLKNKVIKKWSLPGGFIKKTENLDHAAARITAERTGLEGLFLKQVKAFGDLGRNAARDFFDHEAFEQLMGFRINNDSWLVGETVTLGFYAITDIVNASPQTDFFSEECQWFPVYALPSLGFDHDEIVAEALARMRTDLYHFPIGKNLLQPKFTLKEIKTLYEVLSGKKLNATNFPNKLLSLGLLTKLNEKRSIGGHRSPTYYEFNHTTYQKALQEGLVLV